MGIAAFVVGNIWCKSLKIMNFHMFKETFATFVHLKNNLLGTEEAQCKNIDVTQQFRASISWFWSLVK